MRCIQRLGFREDRSLTVAARLRLLLIQRELPSRDREGAVLTGEEFPKTVTHPVDF